MSRIRLFLTKSITFHIFVLGICSCATITDSDSTTHDLNISTSSTTNYLPNINTVTSDTDYSSSSYDHDVNYPKFDVGFDNDFDLPPSPICGNGILEFNEECEKINDGPECEENCFFNRIVFVTPAVYDGGFGGISKANEHCQFYAKEAGLKGKYKAWLSSQLDNPKISFHSENFTGNYKLTNGDLFAEGWNGLDNDYLEINFDAHGEEIPQNNYVWTNTTTTGERILIDDEYTCVNWNNSNPTYYGPAGYTDYSVKGNNQAAWTNYMFIECDMLASFYCFQVEQ